MSVQATGHATARQARPLFKPADLLTAIRLPLAALFPFAREPWSRLTVLGLVALSDFIDGIWARRVGGSRAGAVLDPIADKAFIGTAFVVVAFSGALSVVEMLGVLLRDIVALVAFTATWVLHRPTTLPARAGGKAVTVSQLLTLLAWVLSSGLVRPLAWATAAISVYAVADYSRAARRR